MTNRIDRSRALWNRQDANLESDETLAQLLDRGEMTVWRELYRLGRTDVQLRRRIERIVLNVPLTMPHLCLAALAGLGEPVGLNGPIPDSFVTTTRSRIRFAR